MNTDSVFSQSVTVHSSPSFSVTVPVTRSVIFKRSLTRRRRHDNGKSRDASANSKVPVQARRTLPSVVELRWRRAMSSGGRRWRQLSQSVRCHCSSSSSSSRLCSMIHVTA